MVKMITSMTMRMIFNLFESPLCESGTLEVLHRPDLVCQFLTLATKYLSTGNKIFINWQQIIKKRLAAGDLLEKDFSPWQSIFIQKPAKLTCSRFIGEWPFSARAWSASLSSRKSILVPGIFIVRTVMRKTLIYVCVAIPLPLNININNNNVTYQ